MKMNRNKLLLIIILPLVVFTFAFVKSDIYFQISKNIELFGRIYKEVTLHYVEDVDPDVFMKAGIEGMLKSLDPYTTYIDNTRKDEIELITQGKYGGVGITVGIRGDKIIVTEILDGYSAQRQGIKIGDIIYEVSGKVLTSDDLENLSKLVKGEPGSSFEMKVVRNEDKDTVQFHLVREEVKVKNLAYYGFYPENSNNVYIKLTTFSRTAGEELRLALKELREKKEIKSVVLDLRNNPGGLLESAVSVCEKFLAKDNLIVVTKGREADSENKYYSKEIPFLKDSKLVVLVNDGSASASEIVAGAIQDHDRGVIIGERTFGKGLVQTIISLGQDASLKITSARYYTPSGRCIQKLEYGPLKNIQNNQTKYYTDNKRVVYAAGGIAPDSLVKFEPEGGVTQQLLAKGYVFDFADHFYYGNQGINYYNLKDETLFNEFQNYISDKKFEYHSDAEKQIDDMLSSIKSKGLQSEITEDLIKVRSQLQKLSKKEIILYKDELVRELRSELALRYLGQEGKIKDALKYDPQFQAALNILSNQKVYQKLLHKS